ncbi:hypothetical protein AHAS_Ahas05G0287000 [Arachis hypogaea]
MNSLSAPIPCKFYTKEPNLRRGRSSSSIIFSSTSSTTSTTTIKPSKDESYTVSFKTQRACKLGISRYPDFEYDAQGGIGTGSVAKVATDNINELLVSFDLETLYIPPLTNSTTKFLGLPLPPFLKIDIVPEAFQGTINKTLASIYKAPPLMVKTVLTSEESKGDMKNGRGKRLDEEGNCRLVGVAKVDPIDDFLVNSFLTLPTECLAELNAVISIFISS